MKKLLLGTRGSALALAQVALVEAALRCARPAGGVEVVVKTITTSGDREEREKAARESGAGLKGMFTREIEAALLAGEIDAAVHSAKDLPGRMTPGLEIAATLERAPTADILISKSAGGLAGLPGGSRIGTTSVRRRGQVEQRRADVHVEELRGNVPTRLRRLRDEAGLDAIVLAQAGLERLGFRVENGSLIFEETRFFATVLDSLPAIGQGAIALQIRAGDAATRALLHGLNHAPTFTRLRAERELLRLLDGDCNLPVGVETVMEGTSLRMSAIVFQNGAQPPLTASLAGDACEPEALAARLFAQLYGHHANQN